MWLIFGNWNYVFNYKNYEKFSKKKSVTLTFKFYKHVNSWQPFGI